jgi:hypothetical protein
VAVTIAYSMMPAFIVLLWPQFFSGGHTIWSLVSILKFSGTGNWTPESYSEGTGSSELSWCSFLKCFWLLMDKLRFLIWRCRRGWGTWSTRKRPGAIQLCLSCANGYFSGCRNKEHKLLCTSENCNDEERIHIEKSMSGTYSSQTWFLRLVLHAYSPKKLLTYLKL